MIFLHPIEYELMLQVFNLQGVDLQSSKFFPLGWNSVPTYLYRHRWLVGSGQDLLIELTDRPYGEAMFLFSLSAAGHPLS